MRCGNDEAVKLHVTSHECIINIIFVNLSLSGWKDWFATRLTETAVSSAILLKQSPIPDALGVATDASLNGYRRLDEELNIHERLVQAVHTSVNNAIQYGLIFANAALKAGVAYQQTPGYRVCMCLCVWQSMKSGYSLIFTFAMSSLSSVYQTSTDINTRGQRIAHCSRWWYARSIPYIP